MTMISPNLYGRLARYYDLTHSEREYDKEASFVRDLCPQIHGQAPAQVLDLFCGTGGHSIAMARLGFDVVGLDVSEDMLILAKRKAEAHHFSIRFATGDCRALTFGSEFDLVLGLGQSLQYLLSYEEIRSTFIGVRRALKPGGICVFDIIDGWHMLKPFESGRFEVTEDGVSVKRIARTELDRARRIAVCRASWAVTGPDSSLDIEETVEEYRVFFADELIFLLGISGFEMVGVYEDCEALTFVARASLGVAGDPTASENGRVRRAARSPHLRRRCAAAPGRRRWI